MTALRGVLAGAVFVLVACGSVSAGVGSRAPVTAPGQPTSGGRGTVGSSTGPVASTATSAAGGTASTAGGTGAAQPPGGPVPGGFVPVSATWISADQGWALGTAPCSNRVCTSVLRTTDGGHSWVGGSAPTAPLRGDPGAAVTDSVQQIRFADSRNGWAVGGALYATHDGGASWHRVAIGAGRAVVGVGSSAGQAYAAVTSCSDATHCSDQLTVYAAANGSDAWTPVSGPIPAGTEAFDRFEVRNGAWYLPAQDGVHHGDAAGRTASVPDPCPGQGVPAIAVVDAAHLDAACTLGAAAGSTRLQLYGTVDGGNHWTPAGPERQAPSGLYGIADNGQGVLVLAMASGSSELLRTTDDGASLADTHTAVPSGGYGWSDLGFTTAQRGSVVLDRHALYLSADAGASWRPVSF